MEQVEKMFELAFEARKHAYAPYSHFQVGCCLSSDKGLLFSGANVENVAYPSGQCAETSAIGALISQGERKIKSALIVAGGDPLCVPCGHCLQKISEFAQDDTLIYIYGLEGHRKTFTLKELLPIRFKFERNS